MKERKFRYWDAEKKEMIYSDEFGSLEGFFAHAENSDKRFVMDYTGLKDKNGKQTYEGDIVKVVAYGNDDNEFLISTVEFEGGAFSIRVEGEEFDKTAIGWAIDMAHEIEIIGNIYENPERLK